MKIGQHAALTDTGRKRLRNEDALVVAPPLFAVADGMGGAKGGQLAARITASVFDDKTSSSALDAPTRLRALVTEANRQIFAQAQRDPSLTGMGTTLTAAIVEDGEIAIVQVGDSRAYRLRDRILEQLTDDHSLVAELVRAGRLTPEEAALHPQRAVITRALGTDPTVAADVTTIDVRTGDLFLLCSDGLTSMIDDDVISATLLDSKNARDAVRALVRAANQAGGDDNITVTVFEVVEDSWSDKEAASTATPDEDTLSSLDPVPLFPEGSRSASQHAPELGAGIAHGASSSTRSIVPLLVTALALALAGLVVVGAVWGSQRAYWVGADEDGHIAVYQGVPWDVTEGIRLYRKIHVSPLRAPQLSPAERARLLDHDLVREDEARGKVEEYERLAEVP